MCICGLIYWPAQKTKMYYYRCVQSKLKNRKLSFWTSWNNEYDDWFFFFFKERSEVDEFFQSKIKLSLSIITISQVRSDRCKITNEFCSSKAQTILNIDTFAVTICVHTNIYIYICSRAELLKSRHCIPLKVVYFVGHWRAQMLFIYVSVCNLFNVNSNVWKCNLYLV